MQFGYYHCTQQGDNIERDDEKGEINTLRHEKERLLELLDRCDTEACVRCGPFGDKA